AMALARAGNATEANNRRQLSTTERIAATFGLACGLPGCIQFFPERLGALNSPPGYGSIQVLDIPAIG
ncbi:MAG: hypothetical protein WCC71_24780, partial [Candidatus Sulfotelmatobacter sp.]